MSLLGRLAPTPTRITPAGPPALVTLLDTQRPVLAEFFAERDVSDDDCDRLAGEVLERAWEIRARFRGTNVEEAGDFLYALAYRALARHNAEAA